MNKQGVLTMLGFAQKAGKLAAGEAAVENFLKKENIVLMAMSDESSDNRKEYWTKQAEYANVDILTVEISKLDLGWAIGNSPRGIIGIMDQGMAEAIRKKIAE